MTKTKLFWIIATIITLLSATYQRVTGPTYPLSGKAQIENKLISYKFERSHDTDSDYILSIEAGDRTIKGILFWRRYKFDKSFTPIEMKPGGSNHLEATIPRQMAAGKIEYYVKLYRRDSAINLPEDSHVVIRFKDPVPIWILIPHVLAMFISMLLATRTGLEFFNKEPKLKKYTLLTIGVLFVGGFILGPIMQKFAFGEFWTGIPFGFDLTDNKTLIAMAGWLIALFMLNKSANPKRWVLFASILMLLVYMIPHSVLGSELDYNKTEKENQLIEDTQRK
ncbi:MAG: hypothetical protein WC061_04435 [Melioribacteraceae bacterium]